jgi:hypothetical protein
MALRRGVILMAYTTAMRTGHAGSDIAGGPAEYTLEAVIASTERLRKDFPSWRIDLPEGHEAFGTERPAKIIWSAKRKSDTL